MCLSPLAAATLRIDGLENDSDLRDTLRGGSLVVEQTAEDATPTVDELLAAAQADYARLVAVLYDQGYFGPTISIKLDGREASGISPVQPPRQIDTVVMRVDPGPKFRFGNAQVSPVTETTVLPEGFATNETASLSVLKNTASAAIDGWREEGHAKAALSAQNITARHTDRTINADLRIAPGPKLRFGALGVTGNENVRTQRIIDIAGLPEGEVYSPNELRLATQRLRRTGAFASAALIESEQIGAGNTLPITAQINEAKPRRFGFGAEISSLEGLSLSTFWLHRNLLGGAERLRLEAEVSGIGGNSGGTDYLLGARFDRPATFNEDTNFYALARLEQLDEVNFFSRQLDIEAGIERFATEKRTYTLGLGLRRAETEDAFGTNKYALLTLPLSVEFDYRDVKLDATRGYYARAGLTPFLALSGAADGALGVLDLRGYHTFGSARPVTLALRGQLGALFGPELAQAPADYLFYSGGGGTVRGQPYQALGVDLASGEVTGGRAFLGLSAEARIKFSDTIGLVGFVDAGYIGEEEFYDGSGTWHTGAGLGLRYNTGIGPIRLDVAVPTSGPETDEKFQVYIGIGQSF
jgi:translocation and assembly module TamA